MSNESKPRYTNEELLQIEESAKQNMDTLPHIKAKPTAREFWIGENDNFIADVESYDGEEWTGHIRVIEYSAYLDVKKERDEYLNGYNNLLANESDMQRKLDDQVKRLIEERDNLKLQANELAEAVEAMVIAAFKLNKLQTKHGD